MLIFLKRNKSFFIISGIFFLTFLYMLPLRNQAYGDDFAYIQSVQRTLETGKIYISNWSAPSLIFQIAWGAIFAKVFGSTPKAMHLSTVVLLYFASLAFYALLKRITVGTKKALLFAIILFLFPWVFSYSYTFKTDVPYMSLIVIAVYFYINAFQTKKLYIFFLANLAAIGAFLTRQSGALLPISIILLLAHKYYLKRKISVKEIFIALGPTLTVIAIYVYWIRLPGNLTVNQHEQLGVPILKNLSYFLPTSLGRMRAPNDNYLEYLRRIPFYFNNVFGFLLPILLLLKITKTNLSLFFKKYGKAILISYSIYGYLLLNYYYSKFPGGLHYPIEILDFLHTPFISSYSYWDISLLITSLTLPIFATVLGQRTLNYLFQIKRDTRINIKSIALLIIIGIVAVETKIYQIYVTNNSAPSTTWALWTLEKTRNMTLAIFVDAIQQNWIFLSVIGTIMLFTIFILTRFRLRKNIKFNAVYELLVYIPILHLMFMIFIYMQPWPEYVIPIVPFILIWLAKQPFLTVKSSVRIGLLLLVIIYISVLPTKERYENTGIRWEIASQLVEMGASPLKIKFILNEWAWIPWWYYEDTLSEAIKKTGGDKYLLKGKSTFQNLQRDDKKLKTYFDITEIPLNANPISNAKLKNYYLDTGPINFTLFYQKRFLIFERSVK